MAYGYTQTKYGAAQPRQPQSIQSPLVKAMSGGTTSSTNPFGLTDTTDSARVARINGGIVSSPKTTPTPAVSQAPVSTTPAAQPTPQTQPQVPTVYDVNTDPVLQQVNAYTNMNDEQIKAQADEQQRNLIIQSGLESLASNLGDSTLAKAAASNPTSDKARLDKQKDTGLKDLLTSLTTGGHNLGYSGYRTDQEGQIGQGFLTALADLASNTQGNIGNIRSAMLAALAGNQDRRISALGDAYGRAAAAPPIAPGTKPPPATDPGGLTDPGGALSALFLDANDPNVDRLALAAHGRVPYRNVGY